MVQKRKEELEYRDANCGENENVRSWLGISQLVDILDQLERSKEYKDGKVTLKASILSAFLDDLLITMEDYEEKCSALEGALSGDTKKMWHSLESYKKTMQEIKETIRNLER